MYQKNSLSQAVQVLVSFWQSVQYFIRQILHTISVKSFDASRLQTLNLLVIVYWYPSRNFFLYQVSLTSPCPQTDYSFWMAALTGIDCKLSWIWFVTIYDLDLYSQMFVFSLKVQILVNCFLYTLYTDLYCAITVLMQN